MTSTLAAALHAYKVIGEPIASLPVTVADVLVHLKLPATLVSNETIATEITAFIKAAIAYGENETKLTFQQSNFKAWWDFLAGTAYPYEVRKAPLSSITSIAYSYAGVDYTFDVASVSIAEYEGFSRVQPTYGKVWPTTRGNAYSVNMASINFVAGYADGELPADLKNAILMHVAALWANRGDCSPSGPGGASSVSSLCPCSARAAYHQNAIMDVWAGA